jgi:hypothetical protein
MPDVVLAVVEQAVVVDAVEVRAGVVGGGQVTETLRPSTTPDARGLSERPYSRSRSRLRDHDSSGQGNVIGAWVQAVKWKIEGLASLGHAQQSEPGLLASTGSAAMPHMSASQTQ